MQVALWSAIVAAARAGAEEEGLDPAAPKLLGTVARTELGQVASAVDVCWIDGGRGLAVLGENRWLSAWSAATGSRMWERTLANRDATIIAAATGVIAIQGKTVEFIDATGRTTRSIASPHRVHAVAADAAGERLLTCEGAPTEADPDACAIVLRRGAEWAETWRRPIAEGDRARSVAIAADGSTVLWTTSGGEVHSAPLEAGSDDTFLVATGRHIEIVGQIAPRRWLLHELARKRLCALTIGPATVSDASGGRAQFADMRSDLEGIECVELLGADRVVVGRASGDVLLVTLDNPKGDRAIASFRAPVTALDSLGAAAGFVAVCLRDGSVHVIDFEGAEREFGAVHLGGVLAVEASRDGRTFATADGRGRVVVWPSDGRGPQRVVDGVYAPIALSDDAGLLAGCTQSHEVQGVWWDRGERRSTPVEISGGGPTAIRFVPGTGRAFIGSWKKSRPDGHIYGTDPNATLQFVDVRRGELVYAIDPQDVVASLAVDGRGDRVVTSGSTFLRTYDAASGRLLDERSVLRPQRWSTLTARSIDVDPVTGAVVFALDGIRREWTRAAWRDHLGPPYASDDAREEFRSLPSLIEQIRVVRWVPGGRWCVIGGRRLSRGSIIEDKGFPGAMGGFEVFDTTSGACVRRWTPPGGGVWAACIVDGGRKLVEVGVDGAVRLWDLTEICPPARESPTDK